MMETYITSQEEVQHHQRKVNKAKEQVKLVLLVSRHSQTAK